MSIVQQILARQKEYLRLASILTKARDYHIARENRVRANECSLICEMILNSDKDVKPVSNPNGMNIKEIDWTKIGEAVPKA